MKWVLTILTAITIALPIAVAWRFNVPTAIFVLAAWLVVCLCGAAPVVFSVVTRRRAMRQAEIEEASEIAEDEQKR